jgi:GTP-binding protein
MRSTVKEEFSRLAPAKLMSLEETIAYVADDEIIEITPKTVRLRKSELDSTRRKNKSKAKKQPLIAPASPNLIR